MNIGKPCEASAQNLAYVLGDGYAFAYANIGYVKLPYAVLFVEHLQYVDFLDDVRFVN